MGKLAGHTLCRPPRGAKPIKSDYAGKTLLWRLGLDGRWRADDGEPGLAFVGSLADDAIIWSSRCSCPNFNGCAAGAGSGFAFDKLDLGVMSFQRRPPIAAKPVKKTAKKPAKKTKAKRL